MTETPATPPAPTPTPVATPAAPTQTPHMLPLPGPLGQLASLSGLGNVGILIAAVGLMWARIDSIEARFDNVDVRLDTISKEVTDLSTAMQVSTARTVSPDDFADLERRVTIIESKL